MTIAISSNGTNGHSNGTNGHSDPDNHHHERIWWKGESARLPDAFTACAHYAVYHLCRRRHLPDLPKLVQG
jgi:hypothetical protein